jgi:hypothetical protein
MHMQTRPCRGSKATPGADKALTRLECCCGSSFCFDPCLSLGDECAISSSRLPTHCCTQWLQKADCSIIQGRAQQRTFQYVDTTSRCAPVSPLTHVQFYTKL